MVDYNMADHGAMYRVGVVLFYPVKTGTRTDTDVYRVLSGDWSRAVRTSGL